MRTLILSLIVLSPIILKSQVQITENDMPNINDTLRISISGDIGTADPSATGAGFNWDYAFLFPDSQEVMKFVNVTSAPIAYQFYFNNQFLYPDHKASISSPEISSNLGAGTPVSVTEVYNFFKANSGEFTQVGLGGKINGVPTSVKFDPLDIQYRFPMQYQNSDSCFSKFEVDVPGVGFYGRERYRFNEVDGYGTLTTPFGLFQTIRVKSTNLIQDTLYYSSLGFGIKLPQRTEIEYKWLANGEGIPVLKIVTDDFNLITTAYYRDIAREITGIREYEIATNLRISPNPAKNLFSTSFSLLRSEDVMIELFDLTGKRISSFNYPDLQAGNQDLKLEVNIDPGIYFVSICIGKEKVSKKLIVW